MPTYDPVEAALDALAAALDAAVPSLSAARKGWPEHRQSLDLTVGPVLTITPTSTIEEACSPKVIGSSGATRTIRRAYLTIRAQVDLWTAYRAQREDTGVLVDAAFHNQLPKVAGLWTTSTNYYGRPLTIEVTGGRIEDDQSGVERGVWRRSWDITISTDLVGTATIPDQLEVEVDLDTVAGDEAVTEPTYTID